MDKQRERDWRPPQSKKKEMKERLRLEREQFIEEVEPARQGKEVRKPRMLSSFAKQAARKAKLFPDEKVDEIKEEWWGFDPLESLKRTRPKAAEVRIHTAHEAMARDTVEFWKTSGYHTRPG
jgi:hypothetical protein